ncbi:MAG: branched-chain amino acid transaminase [Acidobacteria bacterium]|nr:branched-chain amino acid transaminase [Acidobacteriota bacterium]MCA1612193.1 branched-chain amino acid transaminase [Acidobacteriota bacterium]
MTTPTPLPEYAFFDGRIVPYREARVGVMTHGLQYGTGCFGGLRGFWNRAEEELFVFRPHDHFQRFLESARLLSLELPYSVDDLVAALGSLLRQEGLRADCYIRPLAFAAEERIGALGLEGMRSAVSIVAIPFSKYIENDLGAHVKISAWRRIDDNMIPARGKVSGAYVNTALAKTDAQRGGFDDAIFLDQNGHVSEASAANLFIVRNGAVATPPVTDNILEGITRRSILDMLREELAIPAIERSIDRTELSLADEVFLAGTGVQIVSVTRIDHRPVGTGRMGPVTASLRKLNAEIVRGEVPRYRRWCWPVYASAAAGAPAPAIAR